MTKASNNYSQSPQYLPTQSGVETNQQRIATSPQQHSSDRAATKTDDHYYRHRYSDLYGSKPDDVQRWTATVTLGKASYRGGSQTGAITTGTATYMGREPDDESYHHRHSGLEGREAMQKSARPGSPTCATATMKDDDQW